MRRGKCGLGLVFHSVLVTITLIVAPLGRLHAQGISADELASQYASCAAYYLMISKANPRLEKYAQIGVAAADNASRLSNSERALALMADETRRFLTMMDNDWSKAGVVIDQKAEPCKSLMTVSE